MSSFHFLRPEWLLALLPLLVLLIWLWRRQLRSRSWQAVCDPELLPHLLLGRSQRRASWPLWMLSAGLLLTVLALAGPVWHKQPQPLFRQQSALVVMLDLSNSMAAADLKPSRLERAKLKIEDLLRQRREGQTALIAFAGDAFVVTPLTDDVETITSLLDTLSPDLMPVQGSEPQRAIELGMNLLQQAGLKQGRLLLITDDDRPERVTYAAEDLRKAGFELEVLGVGTTAGAPIPLSGGGFLKDDQGNLVLPKLNEAGLRELATAGGGSYRHLSIDDSDLRGLLSEVDQHRLDEAQQTSGKSGVRWREEGVWLLWPLALLASFSFRRGWLTLIVLLILPSAPAQAMSWQDLWQRPEQQAAHAFADGKYDQAQQLFQDPRWKASSLYRAGQYQEAAKALEPPQSADDWYNKGNALARSGQLPQAVQAYDQALKLNPDHADAAANKKLVEDALQQQKQQQNQQDQQKDQKDSDKQQKKDNSGSQQNDKSQQQKGDQSQSKDNSQQQQSSGQQDNHKQQNADQSSANQQQQDQAQQESKPSAQQPEQQPDQQKSAAQQQAQKTDQKDDAADKDTASTLQDEQPKDEQDRAMQQWLQRIPDDPGGLLRRKFLYQYRQRGRQQETDRPW